MIISIPDTIDIQVMHYQIPQYVWYNSTYFAAISAFLCYDTQAQALTKDKNPVIIFFK